MLFCFNCGGDFDETEAKENELCSQCHGGYLFKIEELKIEEFDEIQEVSNGTDRI